MRRGKLYDLLKDMPKGVLHHIHFDCTEDEDFVANSLPSTGNTS
jgi:hypothetical protein